MYIHNVLQIRSSMSRVLFNTVATDWRVCMDSCSKYNGATAPSFRDQAELEQLLAWATSVTTDPASGQEYTDVVSGIFWVPHRRVHVYYLINHFILSLKVCWRKMAKLLHEWGDWHWFWSAQLEGGGAEGVLARWLDLRRGLRWVARLAGLLLPHQADAHLRLRTPRQTCKRCLTMSGMSNTHWAVKFGWLKLHCLLSKLSMKHRSIPISGGNTLGINRNCTLVFVNFSALDASILKISVAIFKRRSWGFQNTPNLQSLDDFEPSYGSSKKAMFAIFNLL